ncbi:MAG: NAD(P)H-dependent oxidoreductase subunit E [Clostridia bacterium]|nr:NAD(P)H-dependent oxidoreductase subunit E [Clostridia bacterium]MBQ9846509.1 NAD(P)H-dependent oxidoreductase subunit E [Clostridia bacterium]MBQ9957868.1 NAD(P)H-dependent oxidoreductase subunit E [Clostridia bacterium]
MLKKISSLPFNGTPEQEAQLVKFIDGIRTQQGCLMPIMQEAQSIYGYLPLEVQQIIARELEISVEEVYGISTFYAQFALSPKGKYNISVCLGTACYVKGAQALVDRITQILGIGPDECTADGMFSLEACRCIGACGLAPVLTVNDDVYGRLVEKDVDDIIKKYQ